MKKRLLCFITLLTATISAITLTNNVKAATKWNTSKSVTKEENGIKYSAYLTEDGKESWIYQIKLSKKITKLTLPKEINQAKLTRVGFGEELYGEGHDSYINIFGDKTNQVTSGYSYTDLNRMLFPYFHYIILKYSGNTNLLRMFMMSVLSVC